MSMMCLGNRAFFLVAKHAPNKVERPVKNRIGLSRRICLNWVINPFSNMTRTEPREVDAEQLSARNVM
jgi:hypothetical protein